MTTTPLSCDSRLEDASTREEVRKQLDFVVAPGCSKVENHIHPRGRAARLGPVHGLRGFRERRRQNKCQERTERHGRDGSCRMLQRPTQHGRGLAPEEDGRKGGEATGGRPNSIQEKTEQLG